MRSGGDEKKVFQMRKTSRFDRPITLRIRVDGLYLCVAMGSPARPFECRAAIFSRFVVNLFVSVPDGSSERKRFLTRCPTPCGRRKEVRPPANRRHPGERPTSGRFARACCQHDFWMFRPEGLSATSNGRRCAPRAEKPRASGPTPLAPIGTNGSQRSPRGAPCATPKPQVRWYRDLRFDDGPRANPFFACPSLFPPRTRVPPSPPLSVSNGNSS